MNNKIKTGHIYKITCLNNNTIPTATKYKYKKYIEEFKQTGRIIFYEENIQNKDYQFYLYKRFKN